MNQLPETSSEVTAEVCTIIASQASLDREQVTPSATLKDLGVASLDAIEVIFDIEERFDIRFPDRGPNFESDTVQNLIDAVNEALADKATGTDVST